MKGKGGTLAVSVFIKFSPKVKGREKAKHDNYLALHFPPHHIYFTTQP